MVTLDQRATSPTLRVDIALTATIAAAPAAATPAATTPAPLIRSLTRDFLTWLADSPRSYTDTMNAWRSSCPRLTIWEDALNDRLVQVVRDRGATLGEMHVMITARGRAALAHA